MSDWDSHEARFKDICAEWDNAEIAIKRAEQICHKVVSPSIQELRYAGRRIIEAVALIQSDNAEANTIQRRLSDAEFDCLRARHDAVDAATAKMALDLELAARKLGYNAILTVYPEFAKLRIGINNARDKIAESRKDRENRDAIYQTLVDTDFDLLVTQFTAYQESEPIMIHMARSDRRSKAASIFFIGLGICLSLIGIALSL